MTDKEIQDIVDRVITALQQLAPLPPSGPSVWEIVASLSPIVALIAAVVVAVVGFSNIKQQKAALTTQNTAAGKALAQRQLADDRSEWWRRTQWALEASVSEDSVFAAYGTTMLRHQSKSTTATAEDKIYLDTAWTTDIVAASADEAEEIIAEAMELGYGTDMDDSSLTGDNEGVKEGDHG